ncbi:MULTISPECIES: hypothetical protein [unclassified Iodidimonas]|uniref:hypothetical protein n=1 Tax=unclassified Iodidimonas TaxID=2626145 RepID=UPI002482D5F3|nr:MULTISPECIES: hypothetical protein [unclassified Iodidimonas]
MIKRATLNRILALWAGLCLILAMIPFLGLSISIPKHPNILFGISWFLWALMLILSYRQQAMPFLVTAVFMGLGLLFLSIFEAGDPPRFLALFSLVFLGFWSLAYGVMHDHNRTSFPKRRFFAGLAVALGVFLAVFFPPLWIGDVLGGFLLHPFFSASSVFSLFPDLGGLILVIALSAHLFKSEKGPMLDDRITLLPAVTLFFLALNQNVDQSLAAFQGALALFCAAFGMVFWTYQNRLIDPRTGLYRKAALKPCLAALEQPLSARFRFKGRAEIQLAFGSETIRDMEHLLAARLRSFGSYGAFQLAQDEYLVLMRAMPMAHLESRAEDFAASIRAYPFRIRRQNRPSRLDPDEAEEKRKAFHYYGPQIHLEFFLEAVAAGAPETFDPEGKWGDKTGDFPSKHLKSEI